MINDVEFLYRNDSNEKYCVLLQKYNKMNDNNRTLECLHIMERDLRFVSYQLHRAETLENFLTRNVEKCIFLFQSYKFFYRVLNFLAGVQKISLF